MYTGVMTEKKQINLTIVPDDESGPEGRVYANFCAITHTPFDFTLTFCEVVPPTEKHVRQAGADHLLRAQVKARLALPVQYMPNLIVALQESMRIYSEAQTPPPTPPDDKSPVH